MTRPPSPLLNTFTDTELGQVLARTAELLEQGWCQGARARDLRGGAVDPRALAAVRWSLAGALERAFGEVFGEWCDPVIPPPGRLYEWLRADLPAPSLQAWNDAPGRALAEIAAHVRGVARARAGMP